MATYVAFASDDRPSTLSSYRLPKYGAIGVTLKDGEFGNDMGALITQVSSGSPAGLGGLLDGDLIISVAGTRIQSRDQFIDIVRNRPGQFVNVTAWRRGLLRVFMVKVAALDAWQNPHEATADVQNTPRLGDPNCMTKKNIINCLNEALQEGLKNPGAGSSSEGNTPPSGSDGSIGGALEVPFPVKPPGSPP